MEIDIPDLDDVEFVRKCGRCHGYRGLPKHNTDCTQCGGAGKYLTPVGERLIDFLKSLGVEVDEERWKDRLIL